MPRSPRAPGARLATAADIAGIVACFESTRVAGAYPVGTPPWTEAIATTYLAAHQASHVFERPGDGLIVAFAGCRHPAHYRGAEPGVLNVSSTVLARLVDEPTSQAALHRAMAATLRFLRAQGVTTVLRREQVTLGCRPAVMDRFEASTEPRGDGSVRLVRYALSAGDTIFAGMGA